MVNTLFQEGTFTSHSGVTLREKIECEALGANDWMALAGMIHRRLRGRYRSAVPVLRGGAELAKALNDRLVVRPPMEYVSIHDARGPVPWLVVDDVLTTGASITQTMRSLSGPTLGYVVFDRSGGVLPQDVYALFTLDAHKPRWEATHRHYKGGFYRVLGVILVKEAHPASAKTTTPWGACIVTDPFEVDQFGVVYVHETGSRYLRPLEMFLETVPHGEAGSSTAIRRFTPLYPSADALLSPTLSQTYVDIASL